MTVFKFSITGPQNFKNEDLYFIYLFIVTGNTAH